MTCVVQESRSSSLPASCRLLWPALPDRACSGHPYLKLGGGPRPLSASCLPSGPPGSGHLTPWSLQPFLRPPIPSAPARRLVLLGGLQLPSVSPGPRIGPRSSAFDPPSQAECSRSFHTEFNSGNQLLMTLRCDTFRNITGCEAKHSSMSRTRKSSREACPAQEEVAKPS